MHNSYFIDHLVGAYARREFASIEPLCGNTI